MVYVYLDDPETFLGFVGGVCTCVFSYGYVSCGSDCEHLCFLCVMLAVYCGMGGHVCSELRY